MPRMKRGSYERRDTISREKFCNSSVVITSTTGLSVRSDVSCDASASDSI